MSLVQSLRAYNERKKAEQIKDSETDTVKRDAELLEEAYCRLNGPAEKTSASYSVIPKFYSQLPKDDQVLRQKLRAAARTTFLRKMNAGLMTHEELQRLWEVLEESSSPPKTGDELMIHFQDFNKARDKVTEKCQYVFVFFVHGGPFCVYGSLHHVIKHCLCSFFLHVPSYAYCMCSYFCLHTYVCMYIIAGSISLQAHSQNSFEMTRWAESPSCISLITS
jgi:hypothetical protein